MDRTVSYVGDGNQEFIDWMRLVDAAVERRCGLSVYDLPDQCFRDMFVSGDEPEDVAARVLEEEGFPSEE